MALLRTISSAIKTFIGLTDTPSSYAGQRGKVAMVAETEDGLEFGTPQTVDEASFLDAEEAMPDDMDEGTF